MTFGKQVLTTAVLAAAILFTQGSSFLIAALCPHLRPQVTEETHCGPQPSEDSKSERLVHELAHHEKSERGSRPHADTIALGLPKGFCSHCSVHSSKTSGTAVLRLQEAAKRTFDLLIPAPVTGVVAVMVSPNAVVASRAHGPPGQPKPRHILLNIFRI
jgi:hypothetical protein